MHIEDVKKELNKSPGILFLFNLLIPKVNKYKNEDNYGKKIQIFKGLIMIRQKHKIKDTFKK